MQRARRLLTPASVPQNSAFLWRVSLVACGVFGCGGSANDAANGAAGHGGGAPITDMAHGGSGSTGGNQPIVEGGSGGQLQTRSKRLGSSAWDITLVGSWVEPGLEPVAPPQVVLTLDLSDDETTGFTGLFSSPGNVTRVDLTRTADDAAFIGNRLDTSIRIGWSNTVSAFNVLQLDTLTLVAVDSDADGVADRLTGTGTGASVISCGDCSYNRPLTLTLAGTRDHTAPRLAPQGSPINPIADVVFQASESLQSAMVALSGTTEVPLTSVDSVRIAFTSAQVLPFAGRWKAIGAGRDFAGNQLDLSAAGLETLADPGIFAEDGFESQLNAALSGGAALVDVNRGLPIPNGKQALLLPPGSSATFHLKRASATSTLSATFVDLAAKEGGAAASEFLAAVVGGMERVHPELNHPLLTVPTTDPTWAMASTPNTVRARLNDSGTDVVVVISAQACSGGGLCGPLGALLVDDLRLE